jgi:hypothetical protein
MGKVLYSVTMSFDGFIAGPAGDMSWMTEHLGPNPTVDDVIGKIGCAARRQPHLPRRRSVHSCRHPRRGAQQPATN